MFCFLSKIIPFRRHIIYPFSPSTFPELLCVRSQWLSMRHSSSDASNRQSFAVSYFIDTFGFSREEAASASKRVSFETPEKPDLVINFLKSQGFSKVQILRFIREVPLCLRYDPEKTFLPKIEFLKSRGVSSSDIPKVVSSCPSILKRSLSNHLIPSFDFFRDLFQSDDKLIKVLKDFSGILFDINTHVRPNMKILREVGVPDQKVVKLLQFYPRAMTKNPVRFKAIVNEVKEMGFNPLTLRFVLAVYALTSLRKSTWAKKTDAFRKWGWSDNDILAAFRRYPFCMKVSEDKINAVMEFLVNKLGCESSTITRYGVVLSLNFHKRIVPRGSVFQVLSSKGLVKNESLLPMLIHTEGFFLERFILRNEKEASELLKLYQGKLELAG